MQAVVLDVLPVFGGDDVADGVGAVVLDHLGPAGGAGGDVDEHGVAVARGRLGAREDGFLGGAEGAEVEGPLRGVRADGGPVLEGGAGGEGGADVLDDDGVVGGDEHLGVGGFAAVDDVLARQQEGGRDGDGAELVEGDEGEPDVGPLLEDQHHDVALADAQAGEGAGGLVGAVADVAEGEGLDVARVVEVHEGALAGVFGGPGVDDVVGEVEFSGDFQAAVGLEVFVGRVFGAVEEFFQHGVVSLHGGGVGWKGGGGTGRGRVSSG